MKYWIEESENAFDYYEWFSKEKAEATLGYLPRLSVHSIIGSMLFNKEDWEKFLKIASGTIKHHIKSSDLLNGYKFYLFGIGESGNPNSKVFKYRKLWKKLEQDFDIKNFVRGPEVDSLNRNQELFYASCAEFSLSDFEEALRIVRHIPTNYMIFLSNKNDIMSQKFIKDFLENYYINGEREGELDYFQIALHFCTKGNIVFRWGNSSEEQELAMIASVKEKIQFKELIV